MAISKFNFADMAAQLGDSVEDGVSFNNGGKSWTTAAEAKEVVDAINNKKIMVFLELDGNTLGVEAAKAIGDALKGHSEIRKALWKNMFTGRLKEEIPQALKYLGAGLMEANAKLTVLDLSDNALGPNGMVGLKKLLRSPVCFSLQELILNNCGLGPTGGRMLSEAILDLSSNAKKAGTSLNLRVFIAGRNRLENEGAKALSAMFKELKTLEEIVMPQNSIYHPGIAALAEGFKENTNLRVLNLNDNTLTVKGAEIIAEVFTHLPLLREINFGDCLIRTNGAYHFADALMSSHQHLEVAELGFNEINSDGGLVIVQAMTNKPKLKSLGLNGNNFGELGCKQIVSEMAQTFKPNVLDDLGEDNGEEENDENDDEDDRDDDDSKYTEGDEGNDDEDELEHCNDTTEEAEEEDDENASEDTAYVTTTAYTTGIFNNSNSSNVNDANSETIKFGQVTTTTTTTTPSFSPKTSVTAEQFCLSQHPLTLQEFNSIEADNKLQALQNVINQFGDDNHLLLLIFTTLKCAHLAKNSQAALDLATSLYQATFEYAINTKQETRVVDYYLKQLGLLRSEVPFKSDYDLKSCRYALREALKKQQFANDNVKNTFKVFLKELDN